MNRRSAALHALLRTLLILALSVAYVGVLRGDACTKRTNDANATTNADPPSSSTGSAQTKAPLDGWTPLSGVPSSCDLYTNVSPEKLAPPVWGSCADGGAGCRELRVDWASPKDAFYMAFAGTLTNEGPFLVMGRRRGGALAGWSELLMTYADGPVRGALLAKVSARADEGCAVGLPAIGAGRVVAGVVDWTPSARVREYEVALPLDGGAPKVFGSLDRTTVRENLGTHRSAGPSFMAVDLLPGAVVMTVPYDGTPATRVAQFGTDKAWTPEDPIAVNDDVLFWASYEGRAREYVAHARGHEVEPLIEREGKDVYGVRCDGQTLVWIESSPPKSVSPAPHTIELWSSPVATNRSALSPKKLVDLPPAYASTRTFFQSGMLVLRHRGWVRDVVVRLRDNVYWSLDAPTGQWWGDPVYVGPDEIALPVQPPWKQTETSTIRRQTFSDLRAPKPLGGLSEEPTRAD